MVLEATSFSTTYSSSSSVEVQAKKVKRLGAIGVIEKII
jgi:hypothetical protein